MAVSAKLDRGYALSQPLLAFLPVNYIKGALLVTGHASSGHSSYLLGETKRVGWWYYFPVLLLFKTPLALLALFGGAIYLFVRRRPKVDLLVGLLGSSVLFLLLAMGSKANLGVRHILPIFPPLIIAAGWAYSVSQKFRHLTAAALIWLAVVAVVSYPSYLGYFNELAGRPRHNYKIATDSNLDWGQDLKRIKQYIDKNSLGDVYIDYSWDGYSALDYYLGENQYRLLETWRPGQPGVAIIGASTFAVSPNPGITNCTKRQIITNGTYVCYLGGR